MELKDLKGYPKSDDPKEVLHYYRIFIEKNINSYFEEHEKDGVLEESNDDVEYIVNLLMTLVSIYKPLIDQIISKRETETNTEVTLDYSKLPEYFETMFRTLNTIQEKYIDTGKIKPFRMYYWFYITGIFDTWYFYADEKQKVGMIQPFGPLVDLINTIDEALQINAPTCWADIPSYDSVVVYQHDSYLQLEKVYIYRLLASQPIFSLNERRTYFEKAMQIMIEIKDDEGEDFSKLNDDNCMIDIKAVEQLDEDLTNTYIEFTRKYGAKPNPNKICVYAICHNEEQFVERWYESMKEADYVVVLDTGSTDDTVKKLTELGVTVKTQTFDPWRFDTARNVSLQLVPEDANILISTDLDEILEPGWSVRLRQEWIDGKHERGNYKYSWSHLPNGDSGRVFCYNKIHSRKWVWKYPVHELLWNVITDTNMYNDDEVIWLWDDVHLHHYPDHTKSRTSYLPLLELRAKENEDDYYGLIYLAHEYCYREKYTKSIETLNLVLEKHRDKATSTEIASCYLFMGDSYVALKEYDKAIEAYNTAISEEPTYREPYIDLGKLYLELGNINSDQNSYDSAIRIIKQGIQESYRHFTWLERDISWSYEPYDILCQACFYGGYKKDSIVYAAKALSYEPENSRLKENLDVCIQLTDDKELVNQ